MNGDTVTLVQRPYTEIVPDILTAVVGGVVNEPISFDIKQQLYPLKEPAADLREITGTQAVTTGGQRKLVHHTFLKEVDYVFDAGRNSVFWLDGGQWPEDETVFYVDYFRPVSGSPLTDINVGSVTRTLSEAVAREIATVYEQINEAYRSGFVDAATGQSLDLVVSILDIVRLGKDYARGDATFFRDQSISDGNITIPQGTLLSTTKGEATFVTGELRTLQRGQVQISVPIRASDASKGNAGLVKAGTITIMVQPIQGIARVTNFDATLLATEDESDDDLRARAKTALRAAGKGTIDALTRAIAEARGQVLEVWDPNSPPAKQTAPGTVTLLIDAEAERLPALQVAVDQVRAAGVQAALVGRYVFVKPRLRVTVAAALSGPGKEKVIREVIDAMQGYINGLTAGSPAKGEDLLAAVKKVKDASNPVFLDVMAWQSDVGQPGAETLVDALLSAIEAAPAGDEAALRSALTAVVTETASPIPTSQRIPNRGLVQGLTGQPATVDEIRSGKFQATTPGADWSIVLDAEPADILLVEQS